MGKLQDDNNVKLYGFMATKLSLKGNELLIYAVIYSFSQNDNNQGVFNASTAYLREWTNLGKKTVIECLNSLIEKNLIIKLEDNSIKRKPNVYTINRDVLNFSSEKSSDNDVETGVKNTPALVKKVDQLNTTGVKNTPALVYKLHQTGVKITPYKNNINTTDKNKYIYAHLGNEQENFEEQNKNIEKENVAYPPSQEELQKDIAKKEAKKLKEDRFSEFWQMYPRKTAKKKALQAWDKLKLTEELFTTIMSKLELFIKSEQWTKDNGQFIPYPATWLNGSRWEDELPKDKSSSQKAEKEEKEYHTQEPISILEF